MNKTKRVAITIITGVILCVISFYLGYITKEPQEVIVTPVSQKNCIIHSFPADTPLLINTNTGKVGELRLYPRSSPHFEQKKPYGIMMTGGGEGFNYFAFPDEDYSIISINEKNIGNFDVVTASNHICADCLEKILSLKPKHDYFIVLEDNGLYSFHSIDEVNTGFSSYNYTYEKHEGSKNTIGFKMSYEMN